MMQIHRVKRVPQRESVDPCDFCDESMEKGYEFSGDGVGGPRSGTFLRCCDECLAKSRKSSIGYLVEPEVSS